MNYFIFSTYDSLELVPGQFMNMMIGPNGSGKSSILNGLCLGLAGKTSSIGRVTKVLIMRVNILQSLHLLWPLNNALFIKQLEMHVLKHSMALFALMWYLSFYSPLIIFILILTWICGFLLGIETLYLRFHKYVCRLFNIFFFNYSIFARHFANNSLGLMIELPLFRCLITSKMGATRP
jgi:energy-coupling factor transporter ATP-binding protein EcfA2